MHALKNALPGVSHDLHEIRTRDHYRGFWRKQAPSPHSNTADAMLRSPRGDHRPKSPESLREHNANAHSQRVAEASCQYARTRLNGSVGKTPGRRRGAAGARQKMLSWMRLGNTSVNGPGLQACEEVIMTTRRRRTIRKGGSCRPIAMKSGPVRRMASMCVPHAPCRHMPAHDAGRTRAPCGAAGGAAGTDGSGGASELAGSASQLAVEDPVRDARRRPRHHVSSGAALPRRLVRNIAVAASFSFSAVSRAFTLHSTKRPRASTLRGSSSTRTRSWSIAAR